MKNLLFFVALVLFTLDTQGQVRTIEEVTSSGNEISIPYWKGELDNGLTLIIHEDHSDPLIHVDITYHVGSAREELNKSGFAHFFEHMMFQGSKHVADEEHFKIINESGGTLNGSTSRDRTNYYQTVPSNQLETVLWLEADRMGWLLPAVTQKKFEIQRATVKNEKQQRYNNRPYGLWRENTASALYPYGHPYSWLTIGILEDLDRVDVTDLQKFFLRWYGPNNATLTIGGDVNKENVIDLVQKYFGEIPKGPEVEKMKLNPPVLETDRYISYEDANIRFPAILMTLPTVPNLHPDEAALDCFADILGTGRSSYFYKKFVETQKAIQASVFHPCSELGGELTMLVLPFPGQTLAQFEQEMRTALLDFEKEGVSEEAIQKFKARRESSTINSLATVSGKVSQLASYQTFTGNPNYIKRDLDRYLAVTSEDVMRVYNKYIKGKAMVVQSVLPKGGGEEPSKPNDFTPPTSGNNPFPITDYSGLSYKEPKSDFDRSQQPQAQQAPLAKIPDFWLDETENGIRIIGTKNDEVPSVTLRISIDGGQKFDVLDPTKAGLASLTAIMMNESTENYSAEEIAVALEMIGSSISFRANQAETVISVNALTKNLDATLDILEEKLFRPAFKEEDFERVVKQQMEVIQADEKNPESIASLVFNRLTYGEKHIYSLPAQGMTETVENISLDDIRAFYGKYYAPEITEMVVVGDLDQNEILKKLSFLHKWENKNAEVPKMATAPEVSKTKIYLMDKQGAPQSQIRIGYMTDMSYDVTGEYYKSTLMNYNLGGNFNSRINLNLREDKGWTYGARSYFRAGDDPGPFYFASGIKGNASDSAVYEVMKEITDFAQHGITDEELNYLKNSIGQRDALNYEAPGQKAGFLRKILHYDLDRDYVEEQSEIIDSITKEEINALAKKHLPVEKMNIIVVGDKQSVLKGLDRLDYEIVEIDAKGKILSDTDLKVDF